MPLPCVRIVPPQRRDTTQPKTNNYSRRPEGGVLPLQRTSSARMRILPARYRSTPNIGPGKPLMFGKPETISPRVAGKRTYSVLRPDPRVSMAPNFKLKDFQLLRPRTPETQPSPRIRHCKFCLQNKLESPDKLDHTTNSVHKPANPHAIHQTQHQKCRPDARSAVAHHRQWYACYRHPSHYHSNIHQYMK
jgi:hypothetical protein